MQKKLLAIAALAIAMTAPLALAAPADGVQIAIERTAGPQPLVDQAASSVSAPSYAIGTAGGKLDVIAEASAAAAAPGLQPWAMAPISVVRGREAVAYHLRL